MILFYQYIIACSVIGFVWAEILTQPGEAFAWLFKLIDKLPPHLSKPLGGCAKCVTGQIALWTYIYTYADCYSFYWHAYFISLSILITWLLQKITEKF